MKTIPGTQTKIKKEMCENIDRAIEEPICIEKAIKEMVNTEILYTESILGSKYNKRKKMFEAVAVGTVFILKEKGTEKLKKITIEIAEEGPGIDKEPLQAKKGYLELKEV